MCGIVGFISLKDDTRAYSKEKFFREALFTDTLRGSDSTGIMQVSGEEFGWSYHKTAQAAPDYLQEKDVRNRDFKTWCSIGHNRAATVGKVTADNAHPFHHGPITLVHNGTLRSTYPLPHQQHDIQVDSELIAYNLSQEEPEDAEKVLQQLNGAFALVWFDDRDQSVNMVRNGERPLHFGVNKPGDILYLSSDGNLLNFVAGRLGESSSRPSGIWQIATHQHLKYKKGSLVPEVASIAPFTHRHIIPASSYTQRRTLMGTTGMQRGGSTSSDEGFVPARVMIAGELKDIPKAHLTMLEEWYATKPGEEIFFVPRAFMEWGTSGVGEVHGKMFHPEWDAYFDAKVPGVTAGSARNYMSLTSTGEPPAWTCTAVAVDHTSLTGDKHELTFVMRPKWFSWRGAKPCPVAEKSLLERVKEGEEPLLDSYEEALQEQVDEWMWDTEESQYCGPHGHITEQAFEKLCENGCTMCGGNIDKWDHEEIVWVGEMSNQPLCMDCLEYETKGDTG